MIDKDEFERILKQQSQGPQVPVDHGPFPGPAEPAAQTEQAEMDTPKLPSLVDLVDQEVTIEGVARDAFLGAVVLRDNGTPVYLDGLEEWDSATSFKRIQVTGTLRRKKLAPDPVVGPDGGISHGKYGTDYVIEDPTWTLVTP